MPTQKPHVLIAGHDDCEMIDASPVTQVLDTFARPENMVKLLLTTQPYYSEYEIRLSESGIAEEMSWMFSLMNEAQLGSDDVRRVLRLAYHAGYLLEKREGLSNQQYERLLDALLGTCNAVTPTTTLQRLQISCEIPLLVFVSVVGDSRRLSDLQIIVDSFASICRDDFDGEGMLASPDLGDFAEVLGTMARIIRLASTVLVDMPLPECILNQFQWAVRQLLVICMGDRQHFGGKCQQLNEEFVASLLKLGGDSSDVRLARHLGLLSDPAAGFGASTSAETKRPRSSFHSEWSQIAILRSGWGRKRRELAVSTHGTEVVVALKSCGDTVLRGAVEFTLEIDDKRFEPAGTWIETCWQSDDDADYLEMELEMEQGWRIQRQFCVSRRSGAVLIADVVLGTAGSNIRHVLNIEAATPDARFSIAGEGRELFVDTDKIRGLILPVGLSEWRSDPDASIQSELTATNGLELVSSGEGVVALYCPLFFALTPRAADKQFTWRRLVVVKKMIHEAADQATAVRIQVGGRQWLLYRSLAEQANRTFMGQNTTAEFLFGEFLLDGKLKAYVEIS
ncbi:MAG: hypothetical protein HOF15_01030 [Planctomycetaceae bacterium]|nr:hypothetical protein [Planctomycetaceae bacterium]